MAFARKGLEVHSQPVCRIFEQGLEKAYPFFRQVDCHFSAQSREPHGGEQPGQPVAMVAVQVGNKDMLHAIEFAMCFHQLHLSAFSAVDEEKFVVVADELCAWMVAQGWFGRAASEYGDLKFVHLFCNRFPKISMFLLFGKKERAKKLAFQQAAFVTLDQGAGCGSAK